MYILIYVDSLYHPSPFEYRYQPVLPGVTVLGKQTWWCFISALFDTFGLVQSRGSVSVGFIPPFVKVTTRRTEINKMTFVHVSSVPVVFRVVQRPLKYCDRTPLSRPLVTLFYGGIGIIVFE